MQVEDPPGSVEDLQTLWVGGICDQVDEEILYELFLNAGPLISVKIPTDRETKKQKSFAFVRFEHVESVPFAIELFRDTKLFGKPMKLQNRSSGAGVMNGVRSVRDRLGPPLASHLSRHHRPYETDRMLRQSLDRSNSYPNICFQNPIANYSPFVPGGFPPVLDPRANSMTEGGEGHYAISSRYNEPHYHHSMERQRRGERSATTHRNSFDRERVDRRDRRRDRSYERDFGHRRRDYRSHHYTDHHRDSDYGWRR